eukprot:4175523-Lingulodinium_polyedra.AAC.1
MGSLWTKSQGLDPGALMATALLRESNVHCTGGERDERLCRDVLQALVRLGRAHPFGSAKTQRALARANVGFSRT